MTKELKFGETWSTEDAQRVARQSKVPPKDVYFDADSIMKLNDAIGGEKGADNVQQKLMEASKAGTLPSAKPGTKSQIVYWDGDDALVIGYDPDGNMAGFGRAHKHPQSDEFDPEGKVSTYVAEYVVLPTNEGKGMAKHMMSHLENEIAENNTGIGATILYDIQAETEESQAVAKRLINGVFAITSAQIEPYYLTTLIKNEFATKVRTQDPGIQLVNLNVTGKVRMY